WGMNPILLEQIFDKTLLMLIHPTSDRNHNKRKWVQNRAHPRILSPENQTILNQAAPAQPDFDRFAKGFAHTFWIGSIVFNEIEFLNTTPFWPVWPPFQIHCNHDAAHRCGLDDT